MTFSSLNNILIFLDLGFLLALSPHQQNSK